MFKSKKDVDLHVRDVFAKCKQESERLKLCFGIAKQYSSIREFTSAQRYLETYLNSNPANRAEAHKLMGDIQQELGDLERALDSYKKAYTEGKSRDSLNRICDLLSRGIGSTETAESKKKWFDMQKSTVNNNPLSATSSSASSPVIPRRTPINVGGPPKTGFNHSFTNGNSSPLVSSSSKPNGNGIDLQLRYLERRFDDGLGKILDQNTLVLEQMLKIKEEMKDLTDKVERTVVNQEQMQIEMKELKDKVTTYQNNPKDSCRKCLNNAEEPSGETLTVRFANKDNCAQFKAALERLTKLTTASDICPSPQTNQNSSASAPPKAGVKESKDVPLSQLFKKPEGSWNCDACYCTNASGATACSVCNVCRPGYENVAKPQETMVAETPQPNFSFGFPAANTAAPTFNFGFSNSNNAEVPSIKEEKTDNAFSGLNVSGKFSFADLAKNNPSTPSFSFSNPTNNETFMGAGAPLFASTTNKSVEEKEKTVNKSTNADEGEDDFVPTAEFQPVIPLPPLVEVKKGDEDENTIAEYRAKLYRFVAETKEWKERGVGNVKLLQSKTDERKCRVVMWREKIGKLACNFSLFPDFKVTNYQNNPKVLCWKCQDYAEEPSWETFTIRFGNEDNCAHFKTELERLTKFTTASDGIDGSSSPQSNSKDSASSAPPNAGVKESKDVPLSQLFKKPEGSWNCAACYCTNASDATACPACNTARPGYENVAKPQATEPEVPQPKFSFGFPAANSAAPTFSLDFGNPLNLGTSPKVTSSNPILKAPEIPTSTPILATTPTSSDDKSESVFPPLNLSGKFSFADLAKNNSSTPTFSFSNPTNNETFMGAGAPLFASTTNKSVEDKTVNKSANADEGEDDFVPTAEFQPVIPLPPLVEVKKGDEDENTIAEYRAKLYRFVAETKEWKERGVGNVKLLQSKTDERKCRVVMWREKIGKLACNFSLFPDFKVTNYQNNPKVLCWKCQDYAEEPSWETFTIRFGNEDNCAHFKAELERLTKFTTVSDGIDGSSSPQSNRDSASSAPPNGGVNESKDVPLSQLFKKPEGSWNCEACYCTNASDATACPACNTARPGYENVAKPQATEPEVPQPKFSFGFPAANTAAPTFNFGFSNSNNVVVSNNEEKTDNAFAGLNLSGKFSFADLAKNNPSTPSFSFSNPTNNETFRGAGAPLFANTNRSVEEKTVNKSANAEEGEDDFVPTAEFQPVIPLPPLVEVKKGDEDENTIAEYRAKLYRFVAETKEWKERGVGNVKLLQSKTDERKCRVVMWREKIGKLACNFSLFPDFKVTNYQNNPKVLCWKCQDFAEDPAWETFTIRFGNEDSCANFKAELERLTKLTTASDGISSPQSNKDSSLSAPPNGGVKESTDVPLSQLFKKPEGSWNCDACYCTNVSGATACVSCNASRPGFVPVTTPQPADVSTSSCAGCIGCDPDTYRMPERKKAIVEDAIEISLPLDSSNGLPSVVTLNLFTEPGPSDNSNVSGVTFDAGKKSTSSVDDSKNESAATANNSLSNFSFSFQTPEKASPISFQFKTPTFSFQQDPNSSIFGGGGSIFTPPVGGNPPGSTPSPFVSPFAQQSSLLNNSTSPQSVPSGFSLAQPLFTPSPNQSPNNQNVPQQREEDEYEDVDDEEEEDECMFEEDAHVFIQDDVDSSEGFSDKGEAVVRVLYDGESYCARLVVMLDGEIIAEHLVAAETILQPTGQLTYEWTGICNYESPVKSRIKAVFNEENSYNSFATVMADSLEFAIQAGITEAILLEETPGY